MPEETLTAKLKFQGDEGIAAMQRASSAFGRMEASAKLAKEGVQNVKKGFAGFNVVIAGAVAGATAAVKKFGDFDGQMGAVQAVLGKKAEPAFVALEEQALQLGAATSFTAKQSAEAMENLARAGFDAAQIMKAVPQVLDAAAAEGMDLATAADIVASNIKAFQLEASDAARVADALAYVSAKTNTNMVGLQEGLKFVAPVAKQMGINLEDTAAALGVLADVGLKGTLAGTGLKNALLKISQAARGGRVPVGKYKAEIVKTADGGVDLAKTMFNVVAQLQKIKEPTARAQASLKLLGLRGMGTSAAFDALGTNQALVNKLFVDMRDKAKGSASQMAQIRLKGFHGDLVRVGSAIDGAAVAFGKFISPKLQPYIQGLTGFLGDMAKAFGILGQESKLGASETEWRLGKLSSTAVEFARGFKEGLAGVKSVFVALVDVVKFAWKPFGNLFSAVGLLGASGPGIQGTTKMVVQLAAIGVAIKTATSLFSRFASVAKGSFQILKGVLGGVKTGVQGTVSFLSQKLPVLAKLLPASMRKLTGAVTAAEKITAQPVRVVNFDEMAGIPGMAPGAAPMLGAPEVAGKAGGVSKAGAIAGKAAALVPAAVAGYAFGTYIDEVTNASGRLADAAKKLPGVVTALHPLAGAVAGLGAGMESEARARVKAADESNLRKIGSFLLPGLVEASRKPAAPAEAWSRVGAAAPAASVARLKRAEAESARAVEAAVLAAIRPMLDRLPTKEEWQAIAKGSVTVLNVNGREIARASASERGELSERTGTALKSARPRTTARR